MSETTLENIPLDSDIWQLGTVFSEVLICILWGIESLGLYEQRRRQETSSMSDLVNSGLEICFHDGQKRLDCIQEVHKEALRSRAVFDRISEPLVTFIEDSMLIPHEQGRVSPQRLAFRFKQLVDRIPREPVIPDPMIQRPERQSTRPHTYPSAIPTVNGMEEALEHRIERSMANIELCGASQDGRRSTITSRTAQDRIDNPDGSQRDSLFYHGEVQSSQGDPEASTRENESQNNGIPMVTTNSVELWRMNKGHRNATPPALVTLIDQLRGRDQLFVIDDALSMRAHLPDIIELTRAMIGVAKKADLDGVEVIFTSNPHEVKKRRVLTWKSETEDLVKQINARFHEKTLPDSTNMEDRLGTILERVALHGKKTSVYVLTDGIWQQSDEPGGGVESPIKNLISRLHVRNRNRTVVTIQFIQFGNDKTGHDRLVWLDDELPKSNEGYLRDL